MNNSARHTRLIRVVLVAALVIAPLAISVPARSAPQLRDGRRLGADVLPRAATTWRSPLTRTPPSVPAAHRRCGRPALRQPGRLAVDCVTVGGPTATVTGTPVRAAPDTPWQLGARTGLSFSVDGKASRVAIAGMPTPPLSPCTAPAPSAPLVRGGYRISW